MSDTQPKALISRAMLVAVTVLLLLGAAKDASVTADELTGWCDWLPWTCETHRTPDDWSDMHETVECRMRRKRFCCNTEPPASANVVPEPYYDTVWCPWEYWSTWSYGSFSPHRQYKRIRTRDRRCACPYTHWTAGSDDTCLGSKAYSEKQEQSLNCTGANCGTPRIIIDDYPPKPFAIVLGCLSVFIVLAVSAIIAIICAIRCKKKRLAAAATTAAAASAPAATQTSFASRLTSSFRRCGVGIFGVLSEPSAPAYGSAAFYNSEALPVPTVSLKVSGEELQQPPPPYTSQPELPRAAAAAEGPSGSSTATSSQPPPPYSPPVYL
uniref:Protein shisa-5 n=1 Tax=Macrostomum lignano TaxID=282301 RepID=A0A1I8FYK5_9PLAT